MGTKYFIEQFIHSFNDTQQHTHITMAALQLSAANTME